MTTNHSGQYSLSYTYVLFSMFNNRFLEALSLGRFELEIA